MNLGDKNRAVRSVRCCTSFFQNYMQPKLFARSKLTCFLVLCSVVNVFLWTQYEHNSRFTSE